MGDPMGVLNCEGVKVSEAKGIFVDDAKALSPNLLALSGKVESNG